MGSLSLILLSSAALSAHALLATAPLPPARAIATPPTATAVSGGAVPRPQLAYLSSVPRPGGGSSRTVALAALQMAAWQMPRPLPRSAAQWASRVGGQLRHKLRRLVLLFLVVGRLLVPGAPLIAQPAAPPSTGAERTAPTTTHGAPNAFRRAPGELLLKLKRGTTSTEAEAQVQQHQQQQQRQQWQQQREQRREQRRRQQQQQWQQPPRQSVAASGNAATTGGSSRSAGSAAPAARAPLATVAAPSAQQSPISAAAANVANAVKEARDHISPVERDTILLLAATSLVTPGMGLLGLSPVLGFLFAGMVMGPAGLAVISDVETTTKLAELGVVFFLFEMGLELEFERLKSVGRDAFFLGSSQFLLTGLVLGSIAMASGATAPMALVLGGGLALSSSAFVIQLLSEKGELASRFGRASFGILLFQDLAVVPLLVVTPLLGGSGAQLGAALRLAAVKSASALALIFIAGRVLLQRAYKLVASAKDQTSFLAITLVTVLSMSGFTAALGLSDTLGAFLAGVLLAETKYRYQIEADIAPFRGLLLGLFFITTGFSIDLGLAIGSWQLVVGMALGLHLIKTLIVTGIGIASKLKPSAALRSGLLLSQGGEFAFVIFALAQQYGLLLPTQVKLLLTTVVLTMFLTPFLNEMGAKISSGMERRSGKILLPSPDEAESSDYILVCGFGRVGQAVAELLTAKLVRYKAFDMDPYRVAEARELGLPVFFGDATRPEVLQVFMREAKADISGVVVALDKPADCTKAVRALRRLYPKTEDMPIFVRASDEKHRRKLAASGATALETGPQESALLLGGAVLNNIGLPQEEVVKLIDDTRVSMYSTRMRDIFGHDINEDGERRPGGLRTLLRSPAEKAAEKAAEIAAEIESEIVELEELAERVVDVEGVDEDGGKGGGDGDDAEDPDPLAVVASP